MNQTNDAKRLHPDEGALIRVLDEQGDPAERHAVQGHLASCEECSLAYDELRHAASSLRRTLARDEIPVPPTLPARIGRRFAVPLSWRVAAGIVVLLAASSALQPVRAWVMTGWRSVVSLFAAPPSEEVVTETPSPVAPDGAIVSFVPRTVQLFVEVDSWQSDGQLILSTTNESNASAQLLSEDASEHLAIVPSGGILIGNSAASAASYRVTVPHTVVSVTVRIGGSVVTEYRPTLGADPEIVELTRRQ